MSFVIIPMFTGMFLLSGKIFQNKYKTFETNPYIAIPLGFVIFSTITLVTYAPLIILRLPGIVFIIFETVKDFIIFVIIWIHKKHIKLEFNWIKMLSILLVVILVSFIPALFSLIKEGNDYPFHLSRQNNIYLRAYDGASQFEPWTDENVYNSWFMFNSIIIYLFKINGDIEMWWVQTFIISFISVTTILSLLKITFKKIRFVALTIGALILSIILIQSVNIFGFHSSRIGFIITSIILLISSWELIKKPRVRYILLTGATGFTLLSFDLSALWIFSTYMVVFLGVYIYKEKPKPALLILFTTTFAGFMFAISLHRFTNIGSTIGMVIATLVGMLFLWLRNKNIVVSMDALIIKFKKIWLPLTFAILVLVSLSLWLSNPNSDWWFNFNIDSSYLNTSRSPKALTTMLYIFYWMSLALGFLVLMFSARWKRRWDIDTFLILIGLIATIFFFSPFTATFMKLYLVPKAIFANLYWSTMAPLIIGLTLKLGKIIKKRIKGENSAIDRMINV